MNTKYFFFCCLVLAICGCSTVPASTELTGERPTTQRSEFFLSQYEIDSEAIKCIGVRSPRGERVEDYEGLDNYRMVFELRNGDQYLNEIGGKGCNRMGMDHTLRITQYGKSHQYCQGDFVRVSDFGSLVTGRGGAVLGACKLGLFYKLYKIERDDAAPYGAESD